MSRALPKELRTKKTNSLPNDLKSIAEELIGEKFGFEEEVVERKAPDSFRQEYGPFGDTIGLTEIRTREGDVLRVSSEFYDRIRRSNQGYLEEIELARDFRSNRPKARLYIPNPDMSSLMTALKRFKYLNIRHDYVFVMSPGFANEMMYRDRDFGYYFQRTHERPREGVRDRS